MFGKTAMLAAALLGSLPFAAPAQSNPYSKPSGLKTYMTGNAANSSRNPVGGPAVLLMGGGVEVNKAFINRAYPVANGGDVVVLRTDDSNGYNNYLYNLVSGSTKPDSVETLVVDTVTKANSDYVQWAIENAELVFIAGGDQAEYLNKWLGTKVETGLQNAYARGSVLGGSSAGNHVLGDFVYDPDGVAAVTSTEAIANPYRGSMGMSSYLVDMPIMYDIVTDTHFYQRDRMGRAMAFMARLRQDGRTSKIFGVACDQSGASIFIDKNRLGTVDIDGNNYCYIMWETGSTTRNQVTSGQPLIYKNVSRTRLSQGQTFNFATNATNGSTINLSVDGTKSTPFTPSNPY